MERALAEARRRGGLSRADADALSGLGIDLSEIVSRVEEAHGVGALGRTGRAPGAAGGFAPATAPSPGTPRTSSPAPSAPPSPTGDRYIGDEHLLLALTVRPGVPAEVLADHGVTYEALERVLYGAGEVRAG